MAGPQSSSRSCQFAAIHSETPICHLLAMAEVKEWINSKCLGSKRSYFLATWGSVVLSLGVRRGSQTIVQQDGFWFAIDSVL